VVAEETKQAQDAVSAPARLPDDTQRGGAGGGSRLHRLQQGAIKLTAARRTFRVNPAAAIRPEGRAGLRKA
jgi:hypothetical protein